MQNIALNANIFQYRQLVKKLKAFPFVHHELYSNTCEETLSSQVKLKCERDRLS